MNCLEPLKTTTYILSKNGFVITGKINSIGVIKIVFNITSLIITYGMIMLNIRKAMRVGDTGLANWMLCILVPMIYYAAKGFTLLFKRDRLLSILEDLKSDVFNQHSDILNRHIRRVNTLTSLLLQYFLIGAFGVMIVCCFLPFVVNMRMMVPYPFEAKKFEIPYKFCHMVLIGYFALNATCFDVLYMGLLGLGMSQLNILNERLKDAANNQISQAKHANIEIKRALGEYVILHKRIIEFVEKLNELLMVPLLTQYLSACIILCNVILQMTILRDAYAGSIIGVSGYTCITFVQMSAYHYLANEIMYKSHQVIESCCQSNWYNMGVSNQKTLILLMLRAQKPLVMQLYGFIDISLDSFVLVCRWSYSLFALIKARYN